jgi:hypothetical protein
MLESHLSYPVLAFYRSQHEQQSWVGALTVILDTCALMLTSIDGAPFEPARFAFAMARHAVVDLTQALGASPNASVNRLPSPEFDRLQAILAGAGLRVRQGTETERALAELRATYEPFVSALAERVMVSLPPWVAPAHALDDWQTSAWDNQFPSVAPALSRVMQAHKRAAPMTPGVSQGREDSRGR